jgi:hypothetical protein
LGQVGVKRGSVLIWFGVLLRLWWVIAFMLSGVLISAAVHHHHFALVQVKFNQLLTKLHVAERRTEHISITNVPVDLQSVRSVNKIDDYVIWRGHVRSERFIGQKLWTARIDNLFHVAGVTWVAVRWVGLQRAASKPNVETLQKGWALPVVFHRNHDLRISKERFRIFDPFGDELELMKHQSWDRDSHRGDGGFIRSIRALLGGGNRVTQDGRLAFHVRSLGVNITASLLQENRLPDHRGNLQQSNQSQNPCEHNEYSLYLEILASLLAGLIASWGGWLWGGGHKVWGGLVIALSLWLFLSFTTAFAFDDPLFWRPGVRLLTGHELDRWYYQHSEYHQTFQHDGGNVSQKIIDAAWMPVRPFSNMNPKRSAPTYLGILSEVAWKPILAITTLPLALVSFYDLVRSEFIPIPQQDKLQILRFLPDWQWRTWLLSSCALFIMATLHGTYKALLARHKIEDELEFRIINLTSQLEDRIPRLSVEVWDVLVVPYANSAEVFVDASVSNRTPDTQAIVREFRLALEISGREFRAQRCKADLAGYRLFERRNVQQAIISPNEALPLDGLSISSNGQKPILYGVPHRGWLHFSFSNLPEWPSTEERVLYFIPTPDSMSASAVSPNETWGYWVAGDDKRASLDCVSAAILSVEDYLGSGATFMASINREGDRHIIKM